MTYIKHHLCRKELFISLSLFIIVPLAYNKILPLLNKEYEENSQTMEIHHTTQRIPTVTKFDWISNLGYLPYGDTDCENLFVDNSSKPVSPQYLQASKGHAAQIAQLKIKVNEGHSAEIGPETQVYLRLVSLPFVKTICETGFNAGHSTLVWLSVKNDTRVFSFDLGSHSYAKPLAKYLQQMFPGRLTITWGDSTKTLPKFHEDNPGIQCDLIIVDGGHTQRIASADIDNFYRMTSRTNVVVFDDYPAKTKMAQGLKVAWERKKRMGDLLEIFKCSTNRRGFSVGYFIL